MHTRVITFTGVKDPEAGVEYVREKALPVVSEQPGYRGMSVSTDRANGVLGVLSLWEDEAALSASEAALASTRDDARSTFGGELTVESFELLVSEVGESPPGPGSRLLVLRLSMSPELIDDNIAYFRREVAPEITAQPGFQALRNMVNRDTGEGITGTVWADEQALRRGADEAAKRRQEAEAHGVTFGEMSYRVIELVDMR
jgi:heme-degrading monooxygenase HmoA